MRPRLALLAVAAVVAALALTYLTGTLPWPGTRDEKVEVRWPATSPADRELARTVLPEESTDAPMPPTEVAPGVRVREGRAHGLSYFEVILGDADFDDALPLVVLLHGRGDRPRIPGGPFSGVPTPMRLVIPRGPLRLGAGFAWVLTSVTQGKADVLAESLLTRTHHLAALIDTIVHTLPTLGRPVVAGFSQGALLAFSLALHRPDVVGRAFPLAGWVPPSLMPTFQVAPELRVPIRCVHGSDDPVIPIAPTRDVVAMLQALAWEVELVEFEGTGHVVSPEMNATFEAWLEQALREEAPELTGSGLGMEGPEGEAYEPWEPLDEETIDAIERLETQEASPDENETQRDESGENETERDEGNGTDSPGGSRGAAPGN